MDGRGRMSEREKLALRRVATDSLAGQVTVEDLRLLAVMLHLPNLVKFLPSPENVTICVCGRKGDDEQASLPVASDLLRSDSPRDASVR
jgi:hypothetical protein